MATSKKGSAVATVLAISLIGAIMLPATPVAAEKVVVIPLFDSSSSEPAIDMTSYRQPVGMDKTFTVTYYGDPVTQSQLVVTRESQETTVWSHPDGSYETYNELSELFYDPSGQLVGSCTYDQSPPGSLPDESKQVGESWGGAYILTCDSGPPKIKPMLFTLVGVETVTVPAGTFNNCLKIFRNRGNSGSTTIMWYAPGMGWIKRYYEGKDNYGGTVYELSSFTAP